MIDYTQAANALVLDVILHGGNTVFSNQLVAAALQEAYGAGVSSAPAPQVAQVAPSESVVTPVAPVAPAELTPAELLAKLDVFIKSGLISATTAASAALGASK